MKGSSLRISKKTNLVTQLYIIDSAQCKYINHATKVLIIFKNVFTKVGWNFILNVACRVLSLCDFETGLHTTHGPSEGYLSPVLLVLLVHV